MYKKLFLVGLLWLTAFASSVAQTPYFDAFTLENYVKNNVLSPANYKFPEEGTINARITVLTRLFKTVQDKIPKALLEERVRLQDSLASLHALYSQDSLRLSVVKKTKRNILYSTLKRYFPQLDTNKWKNAYESSKDIQANPFFREVSISGTVEGTLPSPTVVSSLAGALSSVGGLDVTNLADGMAKFLVARTKQELATAFFDKFKETISDSNYKDLQLLFPATYMTLNAIGDEIYNYDAYIQTLRESFENDLRQLFVNLPKITDNSPYFSHHEDYAAILKSGCYIAEGLNEKEHPGQILKDYPAKYLNGLNPNWKGTIETLQLISESLRDSSTATDSTSYWVNSEQISRLLNDSTAFQIYLGLIYQEASHWYGSDAITFSDGWTLCKILGLIAPPNFGTYYANYKSYFTNLITQTDKLTSMLAAFKKTSNDSVAVEQFYSYSMATIDFLEAATDVGKLAPTDSSFQNGNQNFFANARDSLALYFDVARSGVSIVWAVKRRSYASAIVNAASIYNLLVSMPYMKEKKQLEQYLDANKDADKRLDNALTVLKKDSLPVDSLRQQAHLESAISDFIKSHASLDSADSALLYKVGNELAPIARSYDTVKAYQSDVKSLDGTTSSVLRYGTFMATIVQAQNSDEVESAIEAFAMPAGSYEIKRESNWDISLNAYAGGFYGMEKIQGVNSMQWNSYGVAAPIGVCFSKGSSSCVPLLGMFCDDGHFSQSLFVSLVDIGALAAFRFVDDSTQSVPDMQLKDIISPGIFYSWGVPHWPVSLNVGWQTGPLLRTVTKTNNMYGHSYTRFSISVCVDIPLLDFYTEPKY